MNTSPDPCASVSMPQLRTQLHAAAAQLAQCETNTEAAIEQILAAIQTPGSRGWDHRGELRGCLHRLRALCQFARSASAFLITFADTFRENQLTAETARALLAVIEQISGHMQTEAEAVGSQVSCLRLKTAI